jgi:hypothetical protein
MCDVRLFSKFGSYASFNRDGRFPAAGRGELQVMQQRRGTMRGAFFEVDQAPNGNPRSDDDTMIRWVCARGEDGCEGGFWKC